MALAMRALFSENIQILVSLLSYIYLGNGMTQMFELRAAPNKFLLSIKIRELKKLSHVPNFRSLVTKRARKESGL